jgi:hypothetical protein
MTPRILLLQGAAIAASLSHSLLDVWIGLFGGPPGDIEGVRIFSAAVDMTAAEALTLVSFAVLYGWWNSPIASATAGVRGGMLALAVLAFVWAFLANGVAGLGVCFPPCASASPWHDITHLASAVFGGWAAIAAWRAYRAMPGPTQAAPAVTAVVLVAFSYAMQALSFRP